MQITDFSSRECVDPYKGPSVRKCPSRIFPSSNCHHHNIAQYWNSIQNQGVITNSKVNIRFIKCQPPIYKSPKYDQCTLSAKDRGVTKNPAVHFELILMHHFSRILRLSSLDLSSVLSMALNSYFRHLNNHSKYGRPKVLKSIIYAPWSLPTVCIRGRIQIKSDFWRLPGVFCKIF